MNPISTQLVKQSFDWFRPCGPGLIAKVMRNLADDSPGVRAMFPEDTTALHQQIFATLGQVVRNIDRFSTLERPLGQLGRICAREGANAGHYVTFKMELLRVMAELAGDDWTPNLASLWDQTLDAVTAAMVVGAIQEELRAAA